MMEAGAFRRRLHRHSESVLRFRRLRRLRGFEPIIETTTEIDLISDVMPIIKTATENR